jgi:hypothetical protein
MKKIQIHDCRLMILNMSGLHVSGVQTDVFEAGQWTRKNDFSKHIRWGCATFIPGDDNAVYIYGGDFNLKELWVYTFDEDKFTPMADMDVVLTFPSCTGFIKSDQSMAIVVAGEY